jgi:hypothetical protein
MNTLQRLVSNLLVASALISGGVHADQSVLRNRAIAYVMTDLFWSVYQTPGAIQECPQGFNDGPREQFEQLFPYHQALTVEETQLRQEIETWHPTTDSDGFEFFQVEGGISWGVNLDGEVGLNDFVHPDGTPGIDNELYRAVGCIIGFRGPDGVEYIFQNKAIADERYNRMMIELTEVDDLENDDSVTVSVYRGLDRLLTDATGSKIVPGGTQRVDTRWGQKLIRKIDAKIVDARFVLNLTAQGATGLLAGYADVDTWYYQLIRNDSTHHLSNGQISGISLYKALRRLADAHPSLDTGENTAISTALDIKMTQVFISHSPSQNAE